VQLKSDPEEAEVSEGAVLLGKTPQLWNTTRGEHKLTFSLDGYREVTQTVLVSNEGQNFSVRLKKIASDASPQQSQQLPPRNDIKGER